MIQKKERQLNFDASDAFFLDKELVAMQNKSFETMTSPLNAEILIPVYRGDPAGANHHEYIMNDNTGTADFASSLDNTHPLVNVTRESFLRKYISSTDAMHITYQDVRASSMALLNMAERKVNAAVERIRFWQNHMAFFGSPAHQIDGWLNAANVNTQPIGGLPWNDVNKANSEILDEMFECVHASMINSDGRIKINRLVMPVAQHALISTTPWSVNSDTTILQFFLNNSPGIDVYAANELKGAFAGGTEGMIAYEYKPEMFYQLVSIDFESRPTVLDTSGYTTVFETRFGGTVVIYPESQQFRYGI